VDCHNFTYTRATLYHIDGTSYIGEWYFLIISLLLAVAVEFLDLFQKFITPLWEEKKLPIHTYANKHADEYVAIGVNKRFNINVAHPVYYVIGFL
jgi:hypothetical protein